jgi:hypothetical protein
VTNKRLSDRLYSGVQPSYLTPGGYDVTFAPRGLQQVRGLNNPARAVSLPWSATVTFDHAGAHVVWGHQPAGIGISLAELESEAIRLAEEARRATASV